MCFYQFAVVAIQKDVFLSALLEFLAWSNIEHDIQERVGFGHFSFFCFVSAEILDDLADSVDNTNRRLVKETKNIRKIQMKSSDMGKVV